MAHALASEHSFLSGPDQPLVPGLNREVQMEQRYDSPTNQALGSPRLHKFTATTTLVHHSTSDHLITKLYSHVIQHNRIDPLTLLCLVMNCGVYSFIEIGTVSQGGAAYQIP